jgi:hypothetical protein
MRILPTALLALAATGAVALPAGAADAPEFEVSGTPRLYTVANQGLGRPVAYVVVKGSRHLHDPRLLVADVHGHSGRTFLWRRYGQRCYRAVFSNQNADGKPISFLTAGSRYRLGFSIRPSLNGAKRAVDSRNAIARSLKRGTLPPGC